MEAVGTYSLTQLSQKTGTGVSTLADLVHGRRRSSEKTIEAVAGALRLPLTTIRGWAAAALGEVGPWEPPAVANRLTDRQRRALDELIRAMVASAESQPAPLRSVPTEVDPPMPDLTRVAARRGESEGQRLRREQDEAAED